MLIAQQAEFDARFKALEATVARLQEQLAAARKDSSTSSKPPSSDIVKPPKPEPPEGQDRRRIGGQPGHPKHERPLLSPDQCDDVIPLKPTACRRCGRELSGEDPTPLRHQVWELPEIKPQVTEYRW